MAPLLFYFCAGLAVLSALNVIFSPKPARALLSLIVTMFSLAVIYVLLGAPFIAMVHMIVYAGAVLVLFLFVIMLQGTGAKEIPFFARFPKIQILAAILTGLFFLGGILGVIRQFALSAPNGVDGSIEAIGRLLFQNYLLPFELTSLLLLLGVLGAVSLAKEDE